MSYQTNEELLRKAIIDTRDFISGMLANNVWCDGQWERGYCAAIIAVLDHFDRITNTAIAEIESTNVTKVNLSEK